MAALLDPRTETPSESPEPVVDGSPQAATPAKIWNPLVVPRDLYTREGLVWQPHQPVSLTVEVNGKRDLTKYAAVMQLVPKLGFVARLGQPGAAAKFQNLHLMDVKRRGSTDIHISLGDLAWTQSRASEASVTAAALAQAGLPSSAAASPDISSNGVMAAPDGCVLGGGAADCGLLSGSSSEGTTAQRATTRSVTATATDVDAGGSTDSRSHADAASDPDEKATVTSSAAGLSAEMLTSCSAAAAAMPTGVAADAAALTAEASTAPVECSADAATARASVARGASPVALEWRCSCTLCPCHLDPEQLETSPGDRQLMDASPNGSVVIDRQACFAKSGTPASDRSTGAFASGAGPVPAKANNAPSGVAPAGTGPLSHISRERLRTLCMMPSMMRSTSSAVVSKAVASGPGESGGRPGLAMLPSVASVSLPPLCSTQASALEPTGKGSGVACAAGRAATAGAGRIALGCLIDKELVLPPALSAARVGDKHALIQCEIDGELEDCKMQCRLVLQDDGRTLALQGISRPLRGLQLLSISETEEGDILICAATPMAEPSALVGAGGGAAGAPAPLLLVAAAGALTAGTERAAPAAAAAMLSRSASGRQRKPSLKARECAVAASGGPKTASAGSAPAGLPPLPPMQSATADRLLGAALSLQQLQQQRPAPQPSSKRLGRPPKARLPTAPPSLSPGVSQPPQQRGGQTERLQPPRLQRSPSGLAYSDIATSEQMQDSQDGCDSQTPCLGWSAKRSRTAPPAGRAASSSMASEGGLSAAEDAQVEGRQAAGCMQRSRRTTALPAAAAAALPPIAAWASAGGVHPAASVLPSGRARRTSNLCSAASLPPLSIPSCGEASTAEATPADDDDATFVGGGPRHRRQRHGPISASRAPSAESPSGRDGRKRAAAAATPTGFGAGVAAGASGMVAAAAAAGPTLEPEPKRAKVGREVGYPEAMDVDCDGETGQVAARAQSQQLLARVSQPNSPQGSDSAAGPGPSSGAGRGTRTAARRAQQQMKQQLDLEPLPASSSDEEEEEEDDSNDGAEAVGGAAARAPVATGGAGGAAAGGAGTDFAPGGAAEQGTTAAAAPPRQKARRGVNAGKSKSKPNRHPSKISNVVRNAGAILLMIGHSPMMYEKQLRATFGNNPDTSKALRLLEEQGKVMRGGLGYRMHPYHYTLTPVGRTEYDRLLLEQGPSHAFALAMGVRLPESPESPATAEDGNRGGDVTEAAAEEAGAGSATAAAGAAEGAPSELESEAQSGEATVPAPHSQPQFKLEPGSSAALTQALLSAPQSLLEPAGACRARLTSRAVGPSVVLSGGSVAGASLPSAGLFAARVDHLAGSECAGGVNQQQQQQAAVPTSVAAPSAQGWCDGDTSGGGDGSSPTASMRSAQQSQQRPFGSAAATETGMGLSLTTGANAATPTAPEQQQGHQPHVLVPDLQHSAGAGDLKEAASAVSAPRPADLSAPAAASAGTVATMPAAPAQLLQPQPQMQTLFTCPLGYQLAAYPTAAFQLAPPPQQQPDAIKTEQDSQAAAAQMPYGNPYAVYSYVPTPFGYLPYPLYGAFAPAGGPGGMMAAPAPSPTATGPQQPLLMSATVGPYLQSYAGVQLPTGAPAAKDAATGSIGVAAPRTQCMPPELPLQLLQPQPPVQSGAQAQTVPPVDSVQLAMQPPAIGQVSQAPAQTQAKQALTVFQVMSQAPVQAHPQAQPHLQSQSQPELQTAAFHAAVPLVDPPQPQQHAQPARTSRPGPQSTVPQPPQSALEPQPSQAQPQAQPEPQVAAQPQPQSQPVQFKYVQQLPSGGWRAEVPSTAGVKYFSPGFSNAVQAAAAADLLIIKLRPGEQLNLGINSAEAATLASLSVEQVQTMLWSTAGQR